MKKVIFVLITAFLCIGFVYADDDIIEEPVYEEPVEELLNDDEIVCQLIDVSNLNYTIVTKEFGYDIKFDNLDSLLPSTNNVTGFYSMVGELYDGRTIYVEIAGGGFRWHDLHQLYRVSGKLTASLPSSWVTEDGYNDMTLSFQVGSSCYYANKSIKLTKPGEPALGIRDRYDVTFSSTKNRISIVGNSIYSTDNLNISVGAISDLSLLNNLKNNVSGAYDNLLTYAKNSEDVAPIFYHNRYNVQNYERNYFLGLSKDCIYFLHIKHVNNPDTDGIYLVQAVDGDTLTSNVNFDSMSNTTNSPIIYMTMTNRPDMYLINFGESPLKFKRLIM